MNQNRIKAIDKLISETKNDPDNVALILVGSSATGEEKEYSDIDLYLVVTDKKFKETEKEKKFFFGTWNPALYYGIEIDGKIIGIDYIQEAIDHANDATRYSFSDAKILFSKNDKIEELIKCIPKYPETTYLQRIRQFYAYVKHYRYNGEDAFKRNNTFHAYQCVIQLIYFSSRLILAYNKKLYPCHKHLLSEVNKCEKCPENFVNKSNHLLLNIKKDVMIEYYQFVFPTQRIKLSYLI
jgi:predicted nucleotidyltransferase